MQRPEVRRDRQECKRDDVKYDKHKNKWHTIEFSNNIRTPRTRNRYMVAGARWQLDQRYSP